jgi:alanyl-tRNA synthetase
MATLMKAEGGDPVEKLEKLLARQKELQREIDTLRSRLNASTAAALLAGAREVAGVKVLATRVEVADPRGLRELADTLKDRLGSGVIVLGCAGEGRANLLVAVTKDLTPRFKAGDIVRELAPLIGGSGGGKPDLAQAGGNRPEQLDEALQAVSRIFG